MAGADNPYRIDDCRGGQNSADPATSVVSPQVVEALNVEWHRATVARKRRGSRLVENDTGSFRATNVKYVTLAGIPDPNFPGSLMGVRIVLEDAAHAWYSWGYGGTPHDWTVGSAIDTPTTNACVIHFNGKWFAAYKSSVDRLHLLGTGGSTGIRTGLAAPTLGTITESPGAITDNRKYRSVVYVSTIPSWRSEPSTESGVRTLVVEQASVAAPGAAPAGEAYDRWELQVASDDDNYATWWVVGNAAATTAIVDNNATAVAASGYEPANELGLFEVQHSAKFLGMDNNRLLLAGAYEDTSNDFMQHRVWFTPVQGDRDEGDDVRIVDTATVKGWVDLDAGDGGGSITGFGPSTLGDILVFKEWQLWRLVRTGNVEAPYIPRVINKSVGTFGYRTICAGQDALGNPSVYFAASRGPMRVGTSGVEYLGAPIENIWVRVNQHGNTHTSQHGTYYPDRGQYWLWVSVDGATVPSVLLIYSVKTGAWATYTGPLATAQCSALLPRFVQEASKGIDVSISPQTRTATHVPYCCPNTNGQIAECDAINPSTGVALDTDLETYSGSGSVWTDGTTYAASVTTGNLPKTMDGDVVVTGGAVVADAAADISVAITLIPNFDTTLARTATIGLDPLGSETIVFRNLDNAQYGPAKAIQAKIGDEAAIASQWVIHGVQLRVKPGADR